jgi:hypothetical protein
MENKEFPNGFESWHETHFEISSHITLQYERDSVTSKVAELFDKYGTGHVMELAAQLTDEFELLNKGREWDGEFYEELESFLMQKLNNE